MTQFSLLMKFMREKDVIILLILLLLFLLLLLFN